jgi:hypothetical protein
VKLRSGLRTKPDRSALFRQVVTDPSVPQLMVQKLSRVFGGSTFAFSTTPYSGRPALANPGLPDAPALTGK